MVQAAQENILHVYVIEGIENLPALLMGANQAHLAQAAHMVGNCRGADANGLSQGLDIHRSRKQGGDDLNPAGVTEDAEQLSNMLGSGVIQTGRQGFGVKFLHKTII